MTRTKVGVVSLGCSKNLVDTEVMLGHLDAAGCETVLTPDDADVLVINTCGFIEAAREESIQAILEAARLKKAGKVRRVVVAGCMVQRYREELAKELAGDVDALLGLDELQGIVEAVGLSAAPRSDLPILGVTTVTPSKFLYSAETPRRRATPPWTAFVKIAEGCDHTCSFCAIPAFRGTFRSRPIDDVVAEAAALSRAGAREINLIAQDSSHYGRDRGAGPELPDLLRRLDAVPELRWIRVHYLYPNTVTDRLVEAMATLPHVAPYVDIPLQHAHPDTLKRMRRGGSSDSHLELLARFRAAMPAAALRSTFIVGFPGETEAEFEALLAFVAAARFDHLGVFTYSHETSTSAYALADDVPAEVKEERRARLMALQQSIAFEVLARRIGATAEVLVEGAHPDTDDLLVGRLATQAPDVDGQVIINDGFVVDADAGDIRLAAHARPGAFARVLLTETAGYDLVGRIVGAA
ncbi:MAG TPA: 30S ribosomal protein S12 methylthiotransferase RimO [Candidatus Polarisedimenticolaceae bacterium]|nr:30S ribosomal protein S12 methylthiotransferase RimO [Candidatus Polarisedimenticolaceae bacterium]